MQALDGIANKISISRGVGLFSTPNTHSAQWKQIYSVLRDNTYLNTAFEKRERDYTRQIRNPPSAAGENTNLSRY
jgi:hypothetical protein